MSVEKVEQNYTIPWMPIEADHFDNAQNTEAPDNSNATNTSNGIEGVDGGSIGDSAGTMSVGDGGCVSASGGQSCSAGIGM